MSEDKVWVEGWDRGFQEGYDKAIEEIVYILEQGNLNKIYEKVWRNSK